MCIYTPPPLSARLLVMLPRTVTSPPPLRFVSEVTVTGGRAAVLRWRDDGCSLCRLE
jgi:hypothetical protein